MKIANLISLKHTGAWLILLVITAFLAVSTSLVRLAPKSTSAKLSPQATASIHLAPSHGSVLSQATMSRINGGVGPILPRGQTTIINAGNSAIDVAVGSQGAWELFNDADSSVVATSGNKNGWNFGYSKSSNVVAVTVPANAQPGDYDLQYQVGPNVVMNGEPEAQCVEPPFSVQ